MLSSVSYVCLGMCAGMWVISRGINLGVLVLSFISVLLFQRSGFLSVFDVLGCVCSFCFYFADVFSSTMWSDLRAAVPQGFSALQSLASALSDVGSTQYFFQVFFFLQQMEVLGTRTWLDSFSCFSVSLCYLSASFND